MSINAVSGIASAYLKTAQPPAASPAPAATPFGKQLDDVQTTQTLAARGHHHHRGGESQTTAGATASHTGGTAVSALSGLLS